MDNPENETGGLRAARNAERRQAILAAARQSFLERGYADTSMSGLLGAAARSKATLWKHFRSKEELFAAVIDDIIAEFSADVSAALQPAQGLGYNLTIFCTRFISALRSPIGLATCRLVIMETVRFPEIGRIFDDRTTKHSENALRPVLERAIDEGRLAPRPIEEMMDVLLNLCAGQQHRMLWSDQRMEDTQTLARRYVEVFLRAFGIG
ncbi:TetR family transcriptional regulator [Novosphingobium sp. Rr 2-17]|uniref:TetR/AcrR family transcriptional regulator n=1 Tax=Novosphingobium sp. Rr 2-17 TaxID=555793 RepID=UPI0002697E48|nr:TetR/AcrR family transcriptional regulator [Novosphingobium sp. Rr 2-17]EIZ80739.1 TetR family transcriptional regulator [Novosphingobium sp. Rr 2-17]